MTPFPVLPAHALTSLPETHRWLVDGLWGEQAVGIVGGEPKCCKSILALDLAVAVASGTLALGRFGVPHPGRVLLYAAEDALHIVRQRLQGICRAAGVPLESLDVHVITAPTVRLDLPADRQRLEATIAGLAPRLLVLDPFVRLHRVDENVCAEVAPLLAFLRELQRRHQLAVLVVHHARKTSASRAGQALRGTSEFHAWGDCNLYLRRAGERLTLTIEHRAAPSPQPLPLTLRALHDTLALAVTTAETATTPHSVPAPSPEQRVLELLSDAQAPLSLREIRHGCHMRAATLSALLAELVRRGQVHRSPLGYSRAPPLG